MQRRGEITQQIKIIKGQIPLKIKMFSLLKHGLIKSKLLEMYHFNKWPGYVLIQKCLALCTWTSEELSDQHIHLSCCSILQQTSRRFCICIEIKTPYFLEISLEYRTRVSKNKVTLHFSDLSMLNCEEAWLVWWTNFKYLGDFITSIHFAHDHSRC